MFYLMMCVLNLYCILRDYVDGVEVFVVSCCLLGRFELREGIVIAFGQFAFEVGFGVG
jgi:hypothetical protein